MMTPGVCYLVGAGPGDPGLLTIKAKECIEKADVLVYDYLVNPDFVSMAKPGAHIIYAGKKAKDHTLKQEEINALLVKLCLEGKTVCRLKGGDPVLFGRGAEEAEELQEAGVPFEIVPGISSSFAAPIYAGIPVTHRRYNSQLTIFTGHEDPTKEGSSLDYAQLAQTPGTKVMLMGVERLDALASELMSHGQTADTPVALVRWGTTPRQETLVGTLGDIAAKAREVNFKAPAVCVIGGAVPLRSQLNWFENRPLFGRKIVVTRTRTKASELSRKLRELGADVIEIPTIRTEPPSNLMSFGELVQDAHEYDWIVFTSPTGVDAFFEMFYKLYQDARAIGGAKIAVVGPGTAERVKAWHLAVDLMPENYVAEGLVSAFKTEGVEHLKVLWVRAENAREVLGAELTKMGAILDEAIGYRTVPETEDFTGGQKRFREEGADLVTFTSGSTVESFHALNLPAHEGLAFASIGPVTSRTMKKLGYEVSVEADTFSIPGLIDAILEWNKQTPRA